MTIYTPDNCFTIRDCSFLGQSLMQAKIGKLWLEKKHRGLFSVYHFAHTYVHSSKTKGCIRMLYLTNDCSAVRDIYILGFNCMRDTICEFWIQMCITITINSYITTYSHDTSILCCLQPQPQTRISCSPIQNCVCILQVLIQIAIWRATMPDNKAHIPYDYTLPGMKITISQHPELCQTTM